MNLAQRLSYVLLLLGLYASSCATVSTSKTVSRPSLLSSPVRPLPFIEQKKWKVVSYFTNWSTYKQDYQVSDIPAQALTHLVFSFLEIDAKGNIKSTDPFADLNKVFPETDSVTNPQENSANKACAYKNSEGLIQPNTNYRVDQKIIRGLFKQLCILKVKYPHLKVLMAYGGWTRSAPFFEMANNAKSRENFATQAVNWARKWGFDGIDLDWEYPIRGGLTPNLASINDRNNFTKLVKAIAKEIKNDPLIGRINPRTNLTNNTLELTAAVYAGPENYMAKGLKEGQLNIDYPSVIKHMDAIHLMSYDFHGTWDKKTGHNAPLLNLSGKDNSTVEGSVQKLINNGVPSNKIIQGLPAYGRSFANVQNFNDGYNQTFKGPGTGTAEPGILNYHDIVNLNFSKTENNEYWDANSKVPWIFNASSGEFISFDNPRSIKEKVHYVKSNDLGGVMFWEASGDTKNVKIGDLGTSVPMPGDLLKSALEVLKIPN